MNKGTMTAVRCVKSALQVEVGLHQGSALSYFLFAMVIHRLTDDIRQESQWYMASLEDDIVICSESREQVKESLERWRSLRERTRMKFSRSKQNTCV